MALSITRIIRQLKENEKIISTPMIVETINLIGSCHGGKVGYKIFKYIWDNFIIINDDSLLEESMKYFLKYDGTLSLADCTAIEIMKNYKISEILSFDSDFDKVNGIVRIY